MTDIASWFELGGVAAGAGGLGYAKYRAPRVYWSLVGLPATWGRFTWTYRDTMEVCGLTVQPSGFRAFIKRNLARSEVRPVPPKVRRVRPTSAGLRVTLRLPAGLAPADLAASSERLRHAWGVRSVSVAETKPGYVELRMTGYDVLGKVTMPRKAQPRDLVVPVALREDGTVFERDYRKVPMALTLGATLSGKSVYQRNLIKGLAQLPVGLIGIDCKRGVEHGRYASRLSALATDPDSAGRLVDALVAEMEERFDQLALYGVSDLWELPEHVRPVPLVVLIDEVAELFLVVSKKDEAARDHTVMQLVRLGQMARAIGIYLEVCGQRFGSDLGRGATALRAQLTGRVVHRVNDKQTADMGLGDIAPDAVVAVTTIAPDRPGIAVAGDTSGGWSRIRTPQTTPDEAAAVCRQFAHLTPLLPFLAPFRPVSQIVPPMPTAPPLVQPQPIGK
ncbi:MULTISPECIES: FtsK/SpoIIIE domain-containing protein [unclassified Streptomyces]|uniref:FtsK/SpoIIIE domain-containing protein n=1 Tax=unclassified Streptomyces TaxID=2593676 RepID=UPI00225089EA|nr:MULTISPECIES: FtsK/SpoIIIE domain-containing protein [unclassified Streptomyces]MCX5286792.1 FtsK/SpoIIIE domain-containing protein [Streptomyces sp. NBC_00183]